MKELTVINKAIKYAKSEIKQWEKWVRQLEERKKELSNKKVYAKQNKNVGGKTI